MPAKKASLKANNYPTTVKLPTPIAKKLENAKKQTGLSKQELIRLSVDRGLDVLLAQLKSTAAA